MSDITPISVTSIKVIQSELNVSLQQSARDFESYISDRSGVEPLEQSLGALNDVVGILKMLSLPKVEMLGEHMVQLLEQMIAKPEKINDFALSALSHGFVGLPCYLEYLVDREQAAPALILPFVNEIRSALKKPLLLESEEAGWSVDTSALKGEGEGEAAEDLPVLAKRLRQMYQVGLIGLIRDDNQQAKLQLMQRSVSRMANALGSSKISSNFILLNAAFTALLTHDLTLNFSRKRLLTAFDAIFRNIANEGSEAEPVNSAYEQELAYWLALSHCTESACISVAKQLSIEPAAISDKQLQRERDIMQGPNAQTISTMVQALKEELGQSREVLEIAAQDVTAQADFTQLLQLFQRSADILSVVGLNTPSQILADLKAHISSWQEGKEYSRDDLLKVADGLLYIESVLKNLSRLDLNFAEVEADEQSKRQIMANSQLGEAQNLVLQEAQSGIAIAKKDINSFIESDYDLAHIQRISGELASVKGALQMLNLQEAGQVLASCIRFIDDNIQQGADQVKSESVLQTMADALISLEYYLSEYQLHGAAPEIVLQVAKDSLASLGYAVE